MRGKRMAEERTQRKPQRLKEWDYGGAGYYFVTVCTRDKRHLFWKETASVGADIIRPQEFELFELTPYGRIVDMAIQDIPKHYPNVQIDKYVIMPNHIHMILVLKGGGRIISAPTKSVSTIVGQMKRISSKTVGEAIWQKSFYDHIIRDEADYLRIWEYIEENPAKWTEDEYYTG